MKHNSYNREEVKALIKEAFNEGERNGRRKHFNEMKADTENEKKVIVNAKRYIDKITDNNGNYILNHERE